MSGLASIRLALIMQARIYRQCCSYCTVLPSQSEGPSPLVGQASATPPAIALFVRKGVDNSFVAWLPVSSRRGLLLALNLRGLPGATSWSLKGEVPGMGKARPRAGGPEGPPACHIVTSGFYYLKAPRSGPRRAPGGSVQRGAGAGDGL
jgi:hypothetical protein